MGPESIRNFSSAPEPEDPTRVEGVSHFIKKSPEEVEEGDVIVTGMGLAKVTGKVKDRFSGIEIMAQGVNGDAIPLSYTKNDLYDGEEIEVVEFGPELDVFKN